MRHPQSHASARGFTLVELMMVVTIMAVLMTLFGPGASNVRKGTDLLDSAEIVRETLEFARSSAATNNRAHRVRFFQAAPDNGGMIQVYRGSTNACLFNATDPIIRELFLQAGGNDSSVNTAEINAPELKRLGSTVQITSISPKAIASEGVCFRPDGSVRDAATNRPIVPLDAGGLYGAGDVLLTLQDNIVTLNGPSPSYTPTGTPLRIILPYNGLARLVY
jgi:prepilin-type N-terminal cleavage/methylation domain-containing protein